MAKQIPVYVQGNAGNVCISQCNARVLLLILVAPA